MKLVRQLFMCQEDRSWRNVENIVVIEIVQKLTYAIVCVK